MKSCQECRKLKKIIKGKALCREFVHREGAVVEELTERPAIGCPKFSRIKKDEPLVKIRSFQRQIKYGKEDVDV